MPGFAIRGLHYDIEKGLLLKLDSFLQIQLGSVYRGLTPVNDAEVLRLYRNRVIPLGLFQQLPFFQIFDFFPVNRSNTIKYLECSLLNQSCISIF